jgi:hypothetical protein
VKRMSLLGMSLAGVLALGATASSGCTCERAPKGEVRRMPAKQLDGIGWAA